MFGPYLIGKVLCDCGELADLDEEAVEIGELPKNLRLIMKILNLLIIFIVIANILFKYA